MQLKEQYRGLVWGVGVAWVAEKGAVNLSYRLPSSLFIVVIFDMMCNNSSEHLWW